ncbi:hypothetical protein B7P43_G11094, partial [Cryptotermes secundus]
MVDDVDNNEAETETSGETITPNTISIPTPNSATGSLDASPLVASVPSTPVTALPVPAFDNPPPSSNVSIPSDKVDTAVGLLPNLCGESQSQGPTPIVIINSMGGGNFKAINSEASLSVRGTTQSIGTSSSGGASNISTSIPLVGLKVPVPNLSSMEENSVTKKVGDEKLLSDSKGGILEKFPPGQMSYVSQPVSLQSENLEKTNVELKFEDEGTRITLKLQQEALDRREKDPMGMSLGMKPSDEMSSVPPMMKVTVKEEMESSNDELSNVQMPLPSGGLLLKEEAQAQNSQQLMGLSNQMGPIIGTSNQNIKLEPGVLREQQASPMELCAGSQQLSPPVSLSSELSPMQIQASMMQMPPSISLPHHSGRSCSPILQVPSHHPHLGSGNGHSSIIRPTTDIRVNQSSDMRHMPDLRQQISDMRQSTDIRQIQDIRGGGGGGGQGSDSRQSLCDMRPGPPSDVRQQSVDIQQLPNGGLEKSLSQMSGGSYSEEDRERDSKSSQSLQMPPVSIPNSSQPLALQHQGPPAVQPPHQYSYMPGSPYHHHQRVVGGEKSM